MPKQYTDRKKKAGFILWKNGFNQKEIADLIGVSEQTLSTVWVPRWRQIDDNLSEAEMKKQAKFMTIKKIYMDLKQDKTSITGAQLVKILEQIKNEPDTSIREDSAESMHRIYMESLNPDPKDASYIVKDYKNVEAQTQNKEEPKQAIQKSKNKKSNSKEERPIQEVEAEVLNMMK